MKLAFEQHGEGKDLVILHGLFGSARNWRTHARTLAESMRVTVVDMRNHGQSPHADEMSYEAMAYDLLELLEAEGLDEAAVLGHSMGGKALMTMALLNPQWRGPMIVADIAPLGYRPRFKRILEGLQALAIADMTSRGEADVALADFIPEKGLRTFLLTNLEREGDGFAWRVNLPAIVAEMPKIEGFPLFDAAPSPVRSLFLRGSDSPYITSKGTKAIARLFPYATVQTIDNAGHWIHADQPKALIDAIQAWL
jgi:pimeloyl-ACP methyl ester carboxylesterase